MRKSLCRFQQDFKEAVKVTPKEYPNMWEK